MNDRDKVRLGITRDRPEWLRTGSVFIRAAHQVGAAVLLGAYLMGMEQQLSPAYLILAAASGVLLFITEWLRHREIYREFSGMATFAKLILLALVPFMFSIAHWLVLAAFVLAAIFAHLPKRWRHRLLF